MTTISNGWTKMREECQRYEELCHEYQDMITDMQKTIDKKNERIDELLMENCKLKQIILKENKNV